MSIHPGPSQSIAVHEKRWNAIGFDGSSLTAVVPCVFSWMPLEETPLIRVQSIVSIVSI